MLFDTHTHYNDEKYDDDRNEVIKSLREFGIGKILNNATDFNTAVETIKLTKEFDFVYGAVGIHPHEATVDEEEFVRMLDLYSEDKVVAIGEIGLDYFYDFVEKDIQKECFIRQIEFSKKIDLPIVIHNRDSHKDMMDILKSDLSKGVRGVFHCFTGSKEMARDLLNMGFYLSFGGPITFKNAKKAIEVVEYIPIDRMLVETDSPYLAPVPNRGKRNDSKNLKYIVEKIAQIKKTDFSTVEKVTYENGEKLFNI